MGQILITVPVDLEDIALSAINSRHSDVALMDLICSIDEHIADAGFTETVVESMLASLRGDYSAEEWARLVQDTRHWEHRVRELRRPAQSTGVLTWQCMSFDGGSRWLRLGDHND